MQGRGHGVLPILGDAKLSLSSLVRSHVADSGVGGIGLRREMGVPCRRRMVWMVLAAFPAPLAQLFPNGLFHLSAQDASRGVHVACGCFDGGRYFWVDGENGADGVHGIDGEWWKTKGSFVGGAGVCHRVALHRGLLADGCLCRVGAIAVLIIDGA